MFLRQSLVCKIVPPFFSINVLLYWTFTFFFLIINNGGSDDKEPACNAGDLNLIPGSGRSPGEGNNYPLHYSCLGNFRGRGDWQAIVQGAAKDQTWLNDWSHTYIFVRRKRLSWTRGKKSAFALGNHVCQFAFTISWTWLNSQFTCQLLLFHNL